MKKTKVSQESKTFLQAQLLISVFAIVISLISLYKSDESIKSAREANSISQRANILSQESNIIAQNSKDISESSSLFEKKQRSSEIVDKQYDDIYESANLSKTMDDITNGAVKVDEDKLRRIINIFENLGSKYCKGIIYKENIRDSFANSLYGICNHKQVFGLFKGKKNATAYLCYIFIPESTFAQTVVSSSIKTCTPIE